MSSEPLALVVEGDAATRRLLHVLLTRAGLEVDVVAHGADARQLLQHVDYDLVTLDLMLPAVAGTELLASAQRATLERTLVISSAPEPMLQKVRRRWPELRVFRKPFEIAELLEAARTVTANASARAITPAGAFCRRSILAGAKAGVIMRVRGTTVEPLVTYGYTPEQVAPYLSMSIDDPYPVCKAAREGAPVWCGSTTHIEPEFPLLRPVFTTSGSRAFAVVPLMRDGVVAGVAAWSYREARAFAEDEQRVLLEIAANAVELIAGAARQPGTQQATA